MIKITLNETQAAIQLKQIAAQLEQPRKLYGLLGESLKKIHNQRFKDQKDPDGNAWQAVSPRYAAYKAKHKKGNQILKFHGALSQRTAYNYDDRGVEFGSSMKYAPVHQNGSRKKSGRGSGIPQRKWLGINKENEQLLLEKSRQHLQNVINKITGR
ncbi:phage virion morphogenesis protein [Pasteurellaceae bacterium USgator11]|nr:phage virion morphogenesis protein [Pasteurellaceae bacterium USgator41]TNG98704.1 phage virion morphogenesis protein [Pasteurellaceae bacterium UScroc31]TNH00071.1 phage virion morphogenesis protein [Pasteurellaceae bacterium USgator11]